MRRLNEDLERQVTLRTAELQTSLAELDAFSYSVAHDLRAPVRGIVSFSELLLQDCAESLGDDGRHYLKRVHAAGRHMAEMIDSLLNLSRITRIKLRRRPVNLSALAMELAQELREAEPQRVVEFVIAPGVTANADRDLMRIVLDNLLRNAWKFTSKHAAARIEFGQLQLEGEKVCFVRDDGAGFDMTYAGKLFGAFQRLHQVEEFEGSGIGLATVQRIVQRHGGRIWATAGVEQGATFHFTLAAPG